MLVLPNVIVNPAVNSRIFFTVTHKYGGLEVSGPTQKPQHKYKSENTNTKYKYKSDPQWK